jgi:hypothetical protein
LEEDDVQQHAWWLHRGLLDDHAAMYAVCAANQEYLIRLTCKLLAEVAACAPEHLLDSHGMIPRPWPAALVDWRDV